MDRLVSSIIEEVWAIPLIPPNAVKAVMRQNLTGNAGKNAAA